MFRCVPLDHAWTGDTKLDIRAIYRRPSATGGWDLTTALPLRRHSQWLQKGFEYVTLADGESLQVAARTLQANGLDWREFICDIRTQSPWNVELYLKDRATQDAADLEELRTLIAEFGVDAVVKIKQQQNPNFRLPKALEPETVAAKKR
jgi:hypothetical protein